jgi:hypothetical protein
MTTLRQPLRQQNISAAIQAVEAMGGALLAAQKIRELTGRPCTRERVQKWKNNGISPKYLPIVHKITNIPLTELDPVLYPSYLFNNGK